MKFVNPNINQVLLYFLLILMIFIWGFSFIIADIAIEYVTPLSIALYRLIIASISFSFIDLFHKVYSKNSELSPATNDSCSIKSSIKDWTFIFIASFTGVSFYLYFLYSAIEMIGPSLPSLFLCLLSPIFIAIFSLLFFKEKLNTIKIIGFTIATVGSVLLITGGNLGTLNPKSPNFIGYFFALMTPLLWSIYATVTKKIAHNKSDIEILKYTAYFGTIELLILVILNGEFTIFIINFLNIIIILCALYLGLGCFSLGFYIWQSTSKKMKSSRVASFLYVQPFITILFSFMLHRKDIIVFWNIIGGIIVLVAVLMINYK